MKASVILLLILTGCGSGLKGTWTCHISSMTNFNTITLECRSDGSVVMNGSNFGAKWSGNHTILVPYNPVDYVAGEILYGLAEDVVDANERIVSEEKDLKPLREARSMKEMRKGSNRELIRKEYQAIQEENQDIEKENQPIREENEKIKSKWFRRIPIRWIDNDHIDLGGVPSTERKNHGFSTSAARSFTRTK